MVIVKSVFFFILAGLFEIGGGYLVWLWLREGKSILLGLLGALILALYGIVPTFQTANFGRVYAAYDGIFNVIPDMYDLVGGSIALIGVLVIMYWPR